MTSPIVFIFQGNNKLPDYLIYSLELNRRYSPDIEIYFVSNISLKKKLHGITEVDIATFYSSEFDSYFSDHKKNKWWDGFWNKTIERFFILEAFMKHFNYDSVLHMEIDNIAFNISGIVDIISKSGPGLYYPTNLNEISAASILFVNKKTSIEHLNSYILENKDKNDMQLLYDYRKDYRNLVYDLPTTISDLNSEKVGIFDLNFLGLYIFGCDRRILNSFNTNLKITNKELQSILVGIDSRFQIEGINFYLLINSMKIRVNNVHVHSKIHKRLINNKYMENLIDLANRRKLAIIELNLYYIIRNNIYRFLIFARKLFR